MQQINVNRGTRAINDLATISKVLKKHDVTRSDRYNNIICNAISDSESTIFHDNFLQFFNVGHLMIIFGRHLIKSNTVNIR